MQNKYNFELLNSILRQDFSSFISKVFNTINPNTDYQHNWHIDLIANYLELARQRKITRLIINLPPRSLKSICVSVAWPAWILAHDPSARILASSYSAMLSLKHSIDCRFVMQSEWYKGAFPHVCIKKGYNNKNKFLTNKYGFRFATSVAGSVTGEGGDFLIVDDPHNPSHMYSEKLMNKAIDWFQNTFLTRLNNQHNGVIVVLMQRLHEHDLTCQLMQNNSWHIVTVPAIASKEVIYNVAGNSYQYKQGNVLDPKRNDLTRLQKIEQEIGKYNFSAQYLQKPLSTKYSLLQRSNIYFCNQLPEKFDYCVHSWDTAIKTSIYSNYSVGTIWGIFQDKYYLLSMFREKVQYTELKIALLQNIEKYKAKYILIEDKSSGQALIQDLKNSSSHNIIAVNPTLDKVTRFASIVNMFESGKAVISSQCNDKHKITQELTMFPKTTHNDIVDSISQFLNFIKQKDHHSIIRIRSL